MDTYNQLRRAEDGDGDVNIDVDDRSGGVGDRVSREQGEEQCHSYAEINDERRDFHYKGMAKAGRFKCMICGQTFGRVEHLTRHERSHSREGWLRVMGGDLCDALRRHELVHKRTKRSSLGRGARACSACAIARRKCSGGNPCEGCVKRSIECVAHSNTTTTITRRKESVGVSNGSSYEMVGIVSNQAGERSTSPQSQSLWSKMISPIDTQPQINPRSSIGQYHQGFEMENIDVTGQQMNVQNLVPGVHQQFDQFTSPKNQTSDQISEDARRDSVISYDHQSTSSSILPLHSMTNLDAATNSLMNSNGQTSSQLHIPNTSLSDGLQASAGSWTQYNLSSINWLPYDWVPDYQLEDDTSAMRIIDGTTDINGPSPIYIPGDSISRDAPYSINNATVFTPVSQRQDQIQIDNSPRPTLPSEGAPTTPNSHTTRSTGRYYVDGHGSRLPHVRKTPSEVANSCPLISHPTIDDLEAMAAVGSHYHQNGNYAKPMHEFLRRAIISTGIKGDSGCRNVVMIQVKLLNCVGMMYCGCDELSQAAKSYHRDLIDFCCYEWKASNNISRIGTTDSNLSETYQAKIEWKEWHDAESIRRTGYCIWLLDCMWYFHFQIRPSLSLDDSSVLLPSQEVLWEAESAIDWKQLLSCSSTSPTLHHALQIMYTEKRLQSSMGEFSRILLIHGLFRRTWEVESYLKQPLTQWTPTAQKQTLQHLSISSSIWLPGLQTYTNWRNSACDCLDILHWHANSVIGAASGMEHPTVMHLHLARVVVLTPFAKIDKFAQYLSARSNPTTASSHPREIEGDAEKEIVEMSTCIKRWAVEDQHKARLAVIHAGALFWHVRRFSVDAFYEAPAVYLATLVLWAYGLFAIHGTSRTDVDGNGSQRNNTSRGKNEARDDAYDEDDDEGELTSDFYPSSMQLDRPADDELVQLFVKRGQRMKALVMGVGNLCQRDGRGAGRVLGEGRKLLKAGKDTWGFAWVLEDRLRRLQEASAAWREGNG
ncbi:hypothetical protein EYC80_002643 [Monilinia laxa]|uniref:C2H2-type domain-containing protein n=1 Tax=Monilinia laxa TaxID=61186 RepID=A0A5N6K4J8_MONLA|nr:hypothetical protein EYC80_002643 [Monilinia laxa]